MGTATARHRKAKKQVYLPADLLKSYEHLAVDLDRSTSDLIEAAMRRSLASIEGELAAIRAAENN